MPGEKDESLQTAFHYISWPKAGISLSGGLFPLYLSLRQYNGNSPIPYAHRASLLTAVLAEVLHGLLFIDLPVSYTLWVIGLSGV